MLRIVKKGLKMGRKAINTEKINKALGEVRQGGSTKLVAEKYGLASVTIYRYMNGFTPKTQNEMDKKVKPEPKPRHIPPPVTQAEIKRYLRDRSIVLNYNG